MSFFPSPADNPCVHTCERELLRVVEEFGDLARESSRALVDGAIKRREAEKIKKEGWEAIRQIAQFVKMAEEAAK